MNINFNVIGPTRKPLVKAVSDYLNEPAVYQFTPTYAYRIGCFTVTKEGALEFDDNLDHETVEGVYEAIKAVGFDAMFPTTGVDATTVGHTAVDEETSNADENGTDDGHNAVGEGSRTDGEPSNQDEECVVEENGTGEAHTAVDVSTDAEENGLEVHTAVVEESGNLEESGTAVDVRADADESGTVPHTVVEGLIISLPMAGHTGTSIRNLINILYTRGPLLSKATGGNFGCSEELIRVLKNDACVLSVERVVKTVGDVVAKDEGALTGLEITEERIDFTGFPYTEDSDRMLAFQQLACRMNGLAKKSKRALARESEEIINEKYAFRVWFLRLGMMGEEYKEARKVLLASLSGSSAFKDADMEKRWKEKMAERRDRERGNKERDRLEREDSVAE